MSLTKIIDRARKPARNKKKEKKKSLFRELKGKITEDRRSHGGKNAEGQRGLLTSLFTLLPFNASAAISISMLMRVLTFSIQSQVEKHIVN